MRISAIEPAGPDKRARRLLFSGAEQPFLTTSSSVVKVLALEENMAIDSFSALKKRIDEAETSCAHKRCLRILTARDKTSAELKKRLEDDGYSAACIQKTIAHFEGLGLLDDERYTEVYIRSCFAQKRGWGRIVRDLAHKGIKIDSDDERYAPSAEEEYERATALVRHLPATTQKERDRILRRLITRGYSYPVARHVLDAYRMDDIE